MDIYHIWCNLKDGVKDVDFADNVHAYLGHLEQEGMIAGYRLTRRKLGFAAPGFPEFNITIEVEGLAQLDRAFGHVASRADPAESLHHAVNSMVTDAVFALYRDFPDPVRKRGEERF